MDTIMNDPTYQEARKRLGALAARRALQNNSDNAESCSIPNATAAQRARYIEGRKAAHAVLHPEEAVRAVENARGSISQGRESSVAPKSCINSSQGNQNAPAPPANTKRSVNIPAMTNMMAHAPKDPMNQRFINRHGLLGFAKMAFGNSISGQGYVPILALPSRKDGDSPKWEKVL